MWISFGILIYHWWGWKMIQLLWKTDWWVFLQICGPTISHLNVYLRERNTHVHIDLYTNVKITFICNSQNMKTIQKSINRWINELWYIHPMKLSWAMKRNNPLVIAPTWIFLKIIILSNRNQSKEYILSDLVYIKF